LTPDVQEAICKDITLGVPITYAALRAGVTPATVYSWRAKGRRGESPEYVEFLDATKKAEADAVARNAATINAAATGKLVSKRTVTTKPDGTQKTVEAFAPPQWTAAAWYLERRADRDFASNRHEVAALEKELGELRKLIDGLTRANLGTPPPDPPADRPGEGAVGRATGGSGGESEGGEVRPPAVHDVHDAEVRGELAPPPVLPPPGPGGTGGVPPAADLLPAPPREE
jgi:hypothetical protein